MDGIVVRLGSNTLREDPLAIEYPIYKMLKHPDYDSSTIQHDLAIIKVNSLSIEIMHCQLSSYKRYRVL